MTSCTKADRAVAPDALVALVGAVLLALSLPVRVTVIARGDGVPRVRVRMRALLGLIDTDLHGSPKDQRPAARRGGSSAQTWAFLRSEGTAARLRRCVARLWRAVRTRELRGWVRIGLDDPSDTGELWAALAPVALLLTRRFPDLALAPSFAGAELAVDTRWSVVVVPLEIIAIALAFVVSPATLRALIATRRMP